MTGDALWYEAAQVVGITNALNVAADALGALGYTRSRKLNGTAGPNARSSGRRSGVRSPLRQRHRWVYSIATATRRSWRSFARVARYDYPWGPFSLLAVWQFVPRRV
jgi:hypothetical protein